MTRGLRGRVARLEGRGPGGPAATVWDVVAGAAAPDQLPPAARAWWDRVAPALYDRTPVTDPVDECLAQLGPRPGPPNPTEATG